MGHFVLRFYLLILLLLQFNLAKISSISARIVDILHGIAQSGLGAFFLGISCLFASPPLFVFPSLIVFAFVFNAAIKAGGYKKSLKILYGFICGYFLGNFHWMATAFLVDFKSHGLLAIPAILLFSAIYGGYGTIIMSPFLWLACKKNNAIARYVLMAIGWTIFEFIRSSYLVGGLPWQRVGVIFAANDNLLQLARWVGTEAMDLFAISLATLPMLFFNNFAYKKIAVFLSAILVLSADISGRFVLKNNPTKFKEVIAMGVQGNISQEAIQDSELLPAILLKQKTLVEESLATVEDKTKLLIILSESAVPYYNSGMSEEILKFMADFSPNSSGAVFFASLYQNIYGYMFNAASVLDYQANLKTRYVKQRLVPFGEYIPFSKMLYKFSVVPHFNLQSGLPNQKRVVQLDGDVNAILAICYEGIFGEDFRRFYPIKPNLIINMTNDGWYGKSLGPYQHYTLAKIAAVSAKMPMIRVSNSGISTITDSYGRTIKYLGLGESGTIVSKIPQ